MVTLVTPDGAFGGPVRVAVNQSRELINRGHDVTVVAGTEGYITALPTEVDGVPVKLFPVRRILPRAGFAGFFSAKFILWLVRNISSFDVVHVHLARDLVTSPGALVALIFGKRMFVQSHGMIDGSDKILASVLDWLIIRRVLRRARVVFSLTDREELDVNLVEPRARVVQLPNGVPVLSEMELKRTSSVSTSIEVLMLARMHSIKRPLVFVRMAAMLLDRFPNARFTLVGPDGGQGASISNLISEIGVEGAIAWEGAVAPEESLARMRLSSVFVLPSESEVMPMSALEAMSVGLPVVLCRPCGIADEVALAGAGLIADQTTNSLVENVSSLLSDPVLRYRMGQNGRKLVDTHFSIGRVVDLLESYYESGTFGNDFS
nr:glycosyltransferase [Arthrobacter silviterrae]